MNEEQKDEQAQPTLAESLREEERALHRRFLRHTRPKRPLTADEADKLHRAVEKTLGDKVTDGADNRN